MDYYGHVYFGSNERARQRDFLTAMNSVGIIQVKREEIDEWYRQDIRHNAPGCDNHFVLHGEVQRDRFRNVMETIFPEKEFEITEEPGSREFGRWLKEKSRRARIENMAMNEKGGGLE